MLLVLTENPFSAAIDRAQDRIDHDQSYSFLEERGYDRITQYPQFWVLGSGEGDYKRFEETTVIGEHELHSSMATLFFCYGGVGVAMFTWFMWLVVKRGGPRTYLIVGPAFAFGMTHQGLRASLLWVLLAVVVALKRANATAPLDTSPPKRKLRAIYG
jgi:hypothetical protein